MATNPPETKVEKLALGVANGLSLRRAAGAIDVPETTARRWAAAPDFKARVRRLREGVVDRAVGTLARSAAKAARTLAELCDKPYEPEVRLKAARAVLGDLAAIKELTELSEKLAEIEQRLGRAGGKGGY